MGRKHISLLPDYLEDSIDAQLAEHSSNLVTISKDDFLAEAMARLAAHTPEAWIKGRSEQQQHAKSDINSGENSHISSDSDILSDLFDVLGELSDNSIGENAGLSEDVNDGYDDLPDPAEDHGRRQLVKRDHGYAMDKHKQCSQTFLIFPFLGKSRLWCRIIPAGSIPADNLPVVRGSLSYDVV